MNDFGTPLIPHVLVTTAHITMISMDSIGVATPPQAGSMTSGDLSNEPARPI